ncbi:MAG TPA: stage II sporulation protein P [Eubacteriaceae bacterium]|nr:stage II sporulation protein P [Eubacteriaceae bacterium]
MDNKFNIIFWFLIISLLLAIGYQGSILADNIRRTAQEFQEDEIVEVDNQNNIFPNNITKNEQVNKLSLDFLKLIFKKTIPMMELGYKGKDNNLFLSIFSMTTKINLRDPKTLLCTQIPLLEIYEPDDVKITLEDQIAIYDELSSVTIDDSEKVIEDIKPTNVKINNNQPLVLIYHTHTTESYTSSSKTKIEYISPWRTLDKNKNIARVGEEIKNILNNEYGIQVLHDTTVHDYPSYDGSYTRSLKTVERVLKENPTIKYVFDIHRDGLKDTKKNRENCVSVFGEQKVAKVMMVVGNDNFNHRQNLSFAQNIENQLNKKYPGITRGLLSRDNRKYNQFVSDYAALLEVGSNLNTLEEALEASKPLAKVLGEIIIELEG